MCARAGIMRSVDWLKRKSRDERSDHREPFTSTDEHAHARPLSDPERNILSALLETDFPSAAELRAQVPKTEVVGLCPCGCPNVILAVSPDVAPASLPDLSVDAGAGHRRALASGRSLGAWGSTVLLEDLLGRRRGRSVGVAFS